MTLPASQAGRQRREGDLLMITQQVGSSQGRGVSILHPSPICVYKCVHLHVKSCRVQGLLRPALLWSGCKALSSVSEQAGKECIHFTLLHHQQGPVPKSTLIVMGTCRPGHPLNFCLR